VVLAFEGVLLRPWRVADAPAALRGLTDPEFRRWNTPRSPVVDEAGAVRFIRARAEGWESGRQASFAVIEAGEDRAAGADGAVLGSVAVNLIDPWMRSGRMSYWVLPEARGRKLATRAVEAATRWAFDALGLHRLELGHALGNVASCAVARNCGYLVEGTLRGIMHDPAGGFRPMHLHARLATDPPPARATGPGGPADGVSGAGRRACGA
jgi:RimJ/RimL family protein N-acetyltransferase